MDSSAKILNDNGELNTSVGQSCSDSQLSGISISTVQSEHDCKEPQDLQQSPPEHGPEYNSSQLSDETTITVGSHSETATVDSQESLPLTAKVYADVECQTTDGVFLLHEEYEKLLKQASVCPSFKSNLYNIRSLLQNLENPKMDPDEFEKLCRNAGAEESLFLYL